MVLPYKIIMKGSGEAYELFKKSIKVEKAATFVYYGREPTEKDVEDLHSIYEAGKRAKLLEGMDLLKAFFQGF